MRRVVLWDVDGTLLRGGVAAREALERALATVIGREVTADGIAMSGKTDPGILLEMAGAAGVPAAERSMVVEAACDALPGCFAAVADRFAHEGRVLPGVRAILGRLHDRGDVLQTLLTGNLRATGVAKVAAFGLDGWLVPEVGAYGSDQPVRERLVPLALERAALHLGATIAPDEVWVVGDTPRDLSCAKAGGVRCLLVGTGRFAYDELCGLGADAVVPELRDTDHVEHVLTTH